MKMDASVRKPTTRVSKLFETPELHPILPSLIGPDDLRTLDLGFPITSFDVVAIPEHNDNFIIKYPIIGFSDDGRYMKMYTAKDGSVRIHGKARRVSYAHSEIVAERPPISCVGRRYSTQTILALRHSAVPRNWARTALQYGGHDINGHRSTPAGQIRSLLTELHNQLGHYRYWFVTPSMHRQKQGDTTIYITMEEEHEVIVASALMRGL